VLRLPLDLPGLDLWRLLALGIALLDLYAIARAISRRQAVEATLAWIFAILALPGVGGIAYLLLADPRLSRERGRRRRRRAVRAAERVARDADLLVGPGADLSVLRLLAATAGYPPRPGNRVLLLTQDERATERALETIDRATASIWAEFYIVANDATGQRFLDLLGEKARQGLEVRLIYDAVGSWGIDARRLAAVTRCGVRACEFLPMNPVRRRWSVHLRNHRKLLVVDGRVAYTGSMNVGDEYSGLARRRGTGGFRDSHLELEGPVVADLGSLFAEDWHFATGETLAEPPTPDSAGTAVVSIVPSGPDQLHNASGLAFFSGIAAAREKVWLTSAYFVPDTATIQALISAALRGVDVRLLVPRRLDVPVLGPAARSYFGTLVRGGVRVYEYLPRMLHAKSMTVDGAWGIVGSANVDVRSFRLNFELGALVADAPFARALEAAFEADLADSEEVTRERVDATRRLARLRDGAARLLAPLL
jgi:cardiolipin synthase